MERSQGILSWGFVLRNGVMDVPEAMSDGMCLGRGALGHEEIRDRHRAREWHRMDLGRKIRIWAGLGCNS